MKENKGFFSKVLTGLSFLGKKLLWLFSWYKNLWVKFTHNKYDEFVYKRGLAMIAGTIAAVAFVCLIFQTTYYWTTYKKETIYLSQSEEIYPDDNIWGVRGCYTQNCDSNSSLYYRIKPSFFHHMWSLLTSGRVFLPDEIGSSVPTGFTKCEVVSYGIRFRVMMMFNIYPNILSITCERGQTN